MIRRTAVISAAVAALALSATAAAAAEPIMGNDAVDGVSWASTNTVPNARVDDTPAPTDGIIRSIRYWAKTTGWTESGTIQFIVVAPKGLVTWVSAPVTVAPGVSEARELTLPRAVGVTACKDNGFTAYGFDNQGACIASLMAAEEAGKG